MVDRERKWEKPKKKFSNKKFSFHSIVSFFLIHSLKSTIIYFMTFLNLDWEIPVLLLYYICDYTPTVLLFWIASATTLSIMMIFIQIRETEKKRYNRSAVFLVWFFFFFSWKIVNAFLFHFRESNFYHQTFIIHILLNAVWASVRVCDKPCVSGYLSYTISAFAIWIAFACFSFHFYVVQQWCVSKMCMFTCISIVCTYIYLELVNARSFFSLFCIKFFHFILISIFIFYITKDGKEDWMNELERVDSLNHIDR